MQGSQRMQDKSTILGFYEFNDTIEVYACIQDVVKLPLIHSFPSNEHIRFRFGCSRLRLVAKNWRPINSLNRESNILLTSN